MGARRIGMSIAAALALAWAPGIGPAPASAQAKAPAGVEEAIRGMFAVGEFSEAAISPDGRRVAWVESLGGRNGAPTPNSAIYVADWRAPASRRRITAARGGVAAEGEAVWSPDGKRLAFLSDAAHPGQEELYVESPGEAARQLTHLTGALSDARWSPDGKTIAVLFIENAPATVGPLAAEAVQTGVIGSKVYEQRVMLVDAETGRARPGSPADLYVYEYDWAPDGRRLAGTAAHGRGDDNWWVAELYVFDAERGGARVVYRPPAAVQMGAPRWSPDGRTLAFIGGLMSDEAVVGGDIYTVAASGGGARDLTAGMKATASSIAWTRDSKSLIAGEIADGESAIARVDAATGAAEELWRGGEQIGSNVFGVSVSLSRDGSESATVRQSFGAAPEVWAGPIGKWRQVTRRNAGLRAAWGRAVSVHWKSGNEAVEGWEVYPRDYDPSRRYPLVVVVHGGPASANLPRWPDRWSYAMALAADNYFLLLPNPRGSYGEGESFTRANVKDFGYGDFRDIMAGVDYALRTLPVDATRLGIMGWSYGGYMTMWAVTQTRRFGAAMAGAGLADWLSYYGENQIDEWMMPYFGATVYDDPGVYAKSAPIRYIKQAKTPTLIVVGDRDGECPAPQSYEFWHALKTLGVPTELVVYPKEGHRFSDPAHNRDVILRTLAWFEAHIGPGAGERAGG